MRPTKIFILDNHQMIRDMWTRLISERPKYNVAGASGNWKEGLKIIRTKPLDIVLLDIQLFGVPGFKTVPRILKFSPSTAIIAVSYYAEPVMAKRMIGLGAKGYITKNSSLTELFTAIRQVAKGEIYMCKEITELAGREMPVVKSKGPDLRLLTDRERQVMGLLVKGFSSREMSRDLDISFKTAETHRHNIFRKLNIKGRLQLFTLFTMNS